MMMKAIAYYRSRPSEPEASKIALERQRHAVQKHVEESDLDLIAEFTEQEGEEGSETYPAYVAAVRAASAYDTGNGSLNVMLIIATNGAIGTGEPFHEPKVEGTGGFMHTCLQVRSISAPPEIEIPTGAPDPLCLYANCDPRQLDTLIYFCNAGSGTLTEVVVMIKTISMSQFYTSRSDEERWAEESWTSEKRWNAVPPGRCMLVTSLDHVLWDEVSCYRLAYTDAAGQRWVAEALDVNLNICRLAQDPELPWATFRPVCDAVNQPTPKCDPNSNDQ